MRSYFSLMWVMRSGNLGMSYEDTIGGDVDLLLSDKAKKLVTERSSEILGTESLFPAR